MAGASNINERLKREVCDLARSPTLCCHKMMAFITATAASTGTAGHGALLNWLTSHNAQLGKISIGPSSYGGGVGLFATEGLPMNECLFAVP